MNMNIRKTTDNTLRRRPLGSIKIILSLLTVCSIVLCTSCGNNGQYASQSQSTVGASGSAVTEKANVQSPGEIRYVAENKKYGLALPELEYFKEELEELLYRACVSPIQKEKTDLYDFLKKNGMLGKEQKVTLFYEEGKEYIFDEPDEIDRPYYAIYIGFPEIQKKQSYIALCSYNARGACELADKVKSFSKGRKKWKEWGETTIYLDEEKVGQRIAEEQTEDYRKQIQEDCLKKIKDYCGKGEEYDIYLYDFLPGDQWIKGTVIDCTPDGDIPDSNIDIHVCYKGKKMEKYNGISWYPKTHGTMVGKVSEEDALTTITSWRNMVATENCFLAYRVKGDQIISLKQE